MKLSNYWEFFSTKKFEKNVSVEFFNDCGFAIIDDSGIAIYNAKCEIVNKLNRSKARYVLMVNGVILEIKDGKIKPIYKESELYKNPFMIEYEGSAYGDVFAEGGLLMVKQDDKYLVWHIFDDDKKPEVVRTFANGKVATDFKASYDGKVFVVNWQKSGKGIGSEIEIFNIHGANITPNSLYNVDLLPNGNFVGHSDTDCSLYGTDGQIICRASRSFGIMVRSANFITFEDKLLLNDKGEIVGEANPHILSITHDGTQIFSHKIVNARGVGYHLGGKLLDSSGSNYRFHFKERISVMYSQGMIFPLSFMSTHRGVVNGKGLYYTRLKEMLTH